MKAQKILTIASVMAVSGIILNCSANNANNGGTSSSSFAGILAEDMVLASPTAQRTARRSFASRIFSKEGVHILAGPDATDSAEEKKDALESLVSSTPPITCNIAINLMSAGRANCYGPSVNYTNHDFDASSGSWPGGDLGIWEDEEGATNESCIAAQLNSQMRGAASYIDMGQFVVGGMACVASKNGLALPSAASTSVDLTALMSGVVTVNSSALTVTSASIARDADSGGNPVYVTSLTGTVGTKTITIRLKHIPTSTDDSTNRGKISVKVSDTAPASTDGLSLEYEKVSSTVGRMLLKSINFNAAAQDPFVSGSNFSVSFAKPWNNNANYFLAEFNPTDYTGKFAYAWQAGNGDSHTRVFNTIISTSGGTTSGSGFFGFGPTVQTGAGTINGMICAWTGPDSTHTPVAKVQRQDLLLTSGKFDASASNTTFDPVASCEGTTLSMTWNGGASTRLASATTENLVAVGQVTTVFGAQPTAPTAAE